MLRYASKVGNGFDDQDRPADAGMAPFAQDAPTVNAPRTEGRGAPWLKPSPAAEIACTEMTNEGTLRHPSYLGLRAGNKPEAIVPPVVLANPIGLQKDRLGSAVVVAMPEPA